MIFFFFNDTATTEIYTLSLHDALPISRMGKERAGHDRHVEFRLERPNALPRRGIDLIDARRIDRDVHGAVDHQDRKSTRLNSSHANISYAVFCLKKKKINYTI